jgi:hypothetical protein
MKTGPEAGFQASGKASLLGDALGCLKNRYNRIPYSRSLAFIRG